MGEDNRPELPTQIELKKKLVVCPQCGAHIEVDLVIDITPVTDLIGAFGRMGQAEPEEKGEGNAG